MLQGGTCAGPAEFNASNKAGVLFRPRFAAGIIARGKSTVRLDDAFGYFRL